MDLRLLLIGTALAAASGMADGAAAQDDFGDTALAYDRGVVYDDDLVPGRGTNQPFLVGERGSGRPTSVEAGEPMRLLPPNSPNLIGPDGRLDSAIERNAR